MKFTTKFDKYVCPGDSISIEVDGWFTVTAIVEHDASYHIDDDDGHNVDQQVTGCNEDQQARLLEARRAWFRNEWFYCGIRLALSRKGFMLDPHIASLWGIEANYPGDNNDYLLTVANDLLPEAIEIARDALESLCCGIEKIRRESKSK
jgi:hypothetical protein